MHRRLIARFERRKDGVEVQIKGALKFPVEIVEVTSLPDFGSLVAGRLKAKALNRVLNDEPPLGSVDFEAVGVLVSVGGIIRADHASDRSACEPEGQGHRPITAPGPVRHFGHHRFNRSAQMFELIETVTLCFDEIGMGMRC